MRVRFYGVRGSTPAPGPQTVRYGGNTACVEVRLTDGTVVILDAGTGLRQLGQVLLAEQYDRPLTLLLSHLHWDHIIGVPFFAPIWRAETRIQVFPLATKLQRRSIRQRGLFDGIHFPIHAADVPAKVQFLAD